MHKAEGGLFGRIAPIYALFFNFQRRFHGRVFDRVAEQLELKSYRTVLDVGCGTGALCAVWHERGYDVTGVDREPKMIEVSRRKTRGMRVDFLAADVLQGIPFPDDSFDVVIASYVAHGLPPGERQLMHCEMKRLARHLVVLHDFNKVRSRLVDFVEALEGSDYVRFIETVHDEMTGHFHEVELIELGGRATWYVGKLQKNE